MYYEENEISKVLKTAGWLIIVLGILGALIIGGEYSSWILVLCGIFSCVLSGLLFLGMSEIIYLLDSIRRTAKDSCDKIVTALKEPAEETTK